MKNRLFPMRWRTHPSLANRLSSQRTAWQLRAPSIPQAFPAAPSPSSPATVALPSTPETHNKNSVQGNDSASESFASRLTPNLPQWLNFWERREYPPDHFQQLKPHLSYLTHKQLRQVENAFAFAKQAHSGQMRKDGSLYIIHPMAACKILAGLKLDPATLIAALLHDVVEDCKVSTETIQSRFGDQVALIVEGVTKLSQIPHVDINVQQAENFQKMLLAMARDLRVILVKLADRLHNMRTLAVKGAQSRQRIARETLEIYAPIANRIGLESVFRELQDLSFAQLHPHRSQILQKALDNELIRRQSNLDLMRDEVWKALKKDGVRAQVSTRMKNIYSIYRKMRERHAHFSRIYDVCGLRIVVEDHRQCYQTLGVLHQHYKPMPGRIKDFIALPKSNGYQSLHTTLVGPGGVPCEVQIRSKIMHSVAESGLAAHWLYKEKSNEFNQLEIRAHQWINSLIELQKNSANAGELLENVKIDLFSESVYVFTPKGKIFNLPRGASALDFAYLIHSDIGHHAHLARINGDDAPLRTILKSGDRIEIYTNPMPTVTVASLSYTQTARARSQIRHYLRHLEQKHLQELGEHWLRQMLLDCAEFNDEDLANLPNTDLEKKLMATGLLSAGTLPKFFADIALGAVSPMKVASLLLKKDFARLARASAPTIPTENAAPMPNQDLLTITSSDLPMVKYAPCCFPIPDDAIIGKFIQGEGLIVHRRECKNAPDHKTAKLSVQVKELAGRAVALQWGKSVTGQFISRMLVMAHNEQGVLAEIAAIIAECECNIVGVQMHTSQENITPIGIDILVDHRIRLGRLYKKLHAIPKIKSIIRWREY